MDHNVPRTRCRGGISGPAPPTSVTPLSPGGGGRPSAFAKVIHLFFKNYYGPPFSGHSLARVNEGFTLEGNLALRAC